MASLIEKYGGLLGMASAAVFFIGTASSILLSRHFNPMADYLSLLGVSPGSEAVFNATIAVCGILGAAFAVSLWKQSPSGLPKAGAFILGCSLLLLSALSFITADSLTAHILLSGLVFFLAFLGMIFFSAGSMEQNREVGVFSLASAAIMLPLPLSGLAPAAEHLAVLSVAIWVFVMGYRLNHRDITEEYEWLWQE